jgi:hypothetical protein
VPCNSITNFLAWHDALSREELGELWKQALTHVQVEDHVLLSLPDVSARLLPFVNKMTLISYPLVSLK